MRVIVYVPPGRRSALTRKAVERGARRQILRQHPDLTADDIEVWHTDSLAVARAARDQDQVDKVAGRPEHLLDLADGDWALAVSGSPGRTFGGLAVVPAAWAADLARRHPVSTSAGVVTAAAVAALGAVLLPDDGRRPEAVAPRPSVTSPAVPTTRGPAPSPSRPARPPTHRAPAPTRGGAAAGPTMAAPARPSTRPAPTSSPSPVMPSPTEGRATTSPPAEDRPTTSPPAADREACVLRLRALGVIDVRVCRHHPSG